MLEKFILKEEFEQPRWLVRDLIPLGHLCVMLAQSGIGKSFVVEDLAICMVYEKNFCEHETTFVDVLLIDQDTPTDILNRRLSRLACGVDSTSQPKHELWTMSMGELNFKDNSLINFINKDKFKNFKLIILDSFNTFCSGGNSNKTEDMVTALSRLKADCLNKDRTILIVHHISEKKEFTSPSLMLDDTHISGMGNSGIRQQTDTEYILAGDIRDGRVTELYLRARAKRQFINKAPIMIKLVEPDETRLILQFDGYYEPGISDSERDIMSLFQATPDDEYTVKEVIDKTGKKHSEKDTREALAALEKKNKIMLSRARSNLFKYRLPKS
jgi:archaellum biogenesis ATPase FlaH